MDGEQREGIRERLAYGLPVALPDVRALLTALTAAEAERDEAQAHTADAMMAHGLAVESLRHVEAECKRDMAACEGHRRRLAALEAAAERWFTVCCNDTQAWAEADHALGTAIMARRLWRSDQRIIRRSRAVSASIAPPSPPRRRRGREQATGPTATEAAAELRAESSARWLVSRAPNLLRRGRAAYAAVPTGSSAGRAPAGGTAPGLTPPHCTGGGCGGCGGA